MVGSQCISKAAQTLARKVVQKNGYPNQSTLIEESDSSLQ